MRKFVFFLFISLIFISCVPQALTNGDEIEYSTPVILNEKLDIGLFSPYEVPLIEGREYEFTATTRNKYVYVVFELEDNSEKWVSLPVLEKHIFSKNISIPKGTKRAKIGVSDVARSAEFYAVYEVLKFEAFDDVLKQEETRREFDEVPEESTLDVSEKIVIDHKFNSKYPGALKRGETYEFEIGPFSQTYCIFIASNGENNIWCPIEHSDGNYFKLKYQVPYDAKDFRIGVSSSINHLNESLVSFYLEDSPKSSIPSEVKNGSQLNLYGPEISDSKITLQGGKLYSISVGPAPVDFKYCLVICDGDVEQLNYFVLDKSNSKYNSNCYYVPNDAKQITIYLSNDYFHGYYRYATINVRPGFEPLPLSVGSNISNAKKVRTDNPDDSLISYLDYIDAKKIGNENPDKLIELCCNKIKEMTDDKYEMLKLVHDTIWYLASYDFDSLDANIYYQYDYKTILSRNLCVCAGFSRLYVYFCEKLNINALYVVGYAKTGNVLENDPEIPNHAWSMVQVDEGWYLVDLTWDCAGTHNGVRDSKYSCKNLFETPSDFIKDHYPKVKELQLLDTKISANQFMSLR